MRPLAHALAGVLLALASCQAALAQQAVPQVLQRLNDYPTAVRADYVFACMQANGQSRTMLDRCACSIDEIASILPYERYVRAETVLSLRRTSGERIEITRSPGMEAVVAELRRAQAEAEMICF